MMPGENRELDVGEKHTEENQVGRHVLALMPKITRLVRGFSNFQKLEVEVVHKFRTWFGLGFWILDFSLGQQRFTTGIGLACLATLLQPWSARLGFKKAESMTLVWRPRPERNHQLAPQIESGHSSEFQHGIMVPEVSLWVRSGSPGECGPLPPGAYFRCAPGRPLLQGATTPPFG
jgi:hypothetical protein